MVQVRKVIWKLFEMMPTPESARNADVAAVQKLIEPLGLAPKRAPMLIRFSREYMEKQVHAVAHMPCVSFYMYLPHSDTLFLHDTGRFINSTKTSTYCLRSYVC